MPKPVVFISHSTRDPEDKARVEALRTALENVPVTVRVDQEDLVLGDAYRDSIARWMDECRTAMIVLSPGALESEEVQNEAAVLAFRKHRAPAFPLIPLLVGGTTFADLKSSAWQRFGLHELEALVTWADNEPVPSKLIERMADVAALYPGTSRREKFERDLANELKEIPGFDLEAAAELLGLANLARWASKEDQSRVFVRRLIESRHEAQVQALAEIANSHLEVAERILERATPYGWIDESAASFLMRAATAAQGRRGVGINSTLMATSRMYARRACWDAPIAPIEGGTSDLDVEETLDRARAALSRALLGTHEATEAELREELAAEDEGPVFVLMQYPPPSREQLERLRTEYSAPTVVVLCGEDTSEEFAEKHDLPHVHYLDPPVAREIEERVADASREALRRWRKSMRGRME